MLLWFWWHCQLQLWLFAIHNWLFLFPSCLFMVSHCLITKQVLANLDKFWKNLIKYWFVCTANERPGQVLRWSIKVKGHMISVQHNCSIAQVFRCSSFMFWVLKMEKAADMVVQLPKLKCLSCIIIRNVYFPPFYSSLTGLRVYGVMDVSWFICTCWQGNNGVWGVLRSCRVNKFAGLIMAWAEGKLLFLAFAWQCWWYKCVPFR